MFGSSAGPLEGTAGPICQSNVPEWMLGPDDRSQMMVLILRRKPNNNSTSNNPTEDAPLPDSIIVGTSIELKIGTKATRTLNASREGRGSRYILRTSSKKIIDSLMTITELTDGTQIEIVAHPTLNTVQGLVYDSDTINKDEQLIQEYLRTQGVHSVRRIKKRVNGTLKNTPLLVLSFHGTVLPKHIYLGLMRTQVRTYYPSPMICFNCGLYGHSKKLCRQPAICLRCSVTHDIPQGEQCSNAPLCLHCKAGHHITSKECPKYKEEEKIVRMKTDRNISFTEARRLCTEAAKKDSFSSVVQEQIQQDLIAKDQLIKTLQNQVAVLKKELITLKKSMQSRHQSQTRSPRDQSIPTTTTKPHTQLSPCSSLQKDACVQNERLSRKDQSFISPPTKRRDNRKANNNEHYMQTRSRSGKRQLDISPTETINDRGKRIPVPLDTSSTPIYTGNNKGPRTS